MTAGRLAGPRAVAAALLLGGLLGLLPGCSLSRHEYGHAIPDTAGLTIGRSTKAEVLTALGPPLEVRRQFDGDLFIYRNLHTRSNQLLLFPLIPLYADQRGSSRVDQVTLLFDHRGVLAGIGRWDPAPEH